SWHPLDLSPFAQNLPAACGGAPRLSPRPKGVLMRSRRFLVAASLLLACAVLPTNRAFAQSPNNGQDIPPPREVVDVKAFNVVKAKLEAAEKELAAFKTAAQQDAKKLDAAIATANEALKKAEEAAKGGGGDAKKVAEELKAAGEKLSALESGAKDATKATEKVTTDAGAALTTGKEHGDN